ncbi:O-methyltransferase [Corynebacterium sp. H113]|uniref:O-methyltransferase n=1 Tax=Corynebacterium sp. H113 TaxID=3133419 RepID=UPI0030B19A8A
MTESTSSNAPFSALDAIRNHINSTTVADEALVAARDDAAEFGLSTPDDVSGSVLTMLMTLATARRTTNAAAVAATPAAGVVGLHLIAGMPNGGQLTCIDPEIEHQKLARDAFKRAGAVASRHRFLPSHPREVLGRLALDAYDLVYINAEPTDVIAIQELAWPLLRSGGVLVFTGVLLDGTVADDTRTDRDTVAAREAEKHLLAIEDATIARLPIGAGTVVLVKN